MKISLRGWLVIGTFAVLSTALAVFLHPDLTAAETSQTPGRLTEQSLGDVLAALGLSPRKFGKRYDFTFKANSNGEEWELNMTAVFSQDDESIWLMVWLAPLPHTSADVPRTALLRLLAWNDRLGNGKFFAYVPRSRCFVLERILANENVTAARLHDALMDLSDSVAATYPHWSVVSWKQIAAPIP